MLQSQGDPVWSKHRLLEGQVGSGRGPQYSLSDYSTRPPVLKTQRSLSVSRFMNPMLGNTVLSPLKNICKKKKKLHLNKINSLLTCHWRIQQICLFRGENKKQLKKSDFFSNQISSGTSWSYFVKAISANWTVLSLMWHFTRLSDTSTTIPSKLTIHIFYRSSSGYLDGCKESWSCVCLTLSTLL